MIIVLITLVILALVVTRMANKAPARAGIPHAIQYVAIGVWLITIAAFLIAAVYYLNMHGINFQPKPIGMN